MTYESAFFCGTLDGIACVSAMSSLHDLAVDLVQISKPNRTQTYRDRRQTYCTYDHRP